jgi:hypothetical protein
LSSYWTLASSFSNSFSFSSGYIGLKNLVKLTDGFFFGASFFFDSPDFLSPFAPLISNYPAQASSSPPLSPKFSGPSVMTRSLVSVFSGSILLGVFCCCSNFYCSLSASFSLRACSFSSSLCCLIYALCSSLTFACTSFSFYCSSLALLISSRTTWRRSANKDCNSTSSCRLSSIKVLSVAYQRWRGSSSFLSFSKRSRILRSMDFLLQSGKRWLKSSMIFCLLSKEPCIILTRSTSLVLMRFGLFAPLAAYFSSSKGST